MEAKVKQIKIEGVYYYVVLIPKGYDGEYKLFNKELYESEEAAVFIRDTINADK